MSNDFEEWRPIPGYENLYEVSNEGRVRSLRIGTRIKVKENRIMCQKYDTNGYLRVNLHKDGSQRSELVSRMVAKAFVPNPNGFPEVGHNDDNKMNNTPENLYWTTQQENLVHNNLHLKKRDKRNQGGIERVKEALSIPVIGTKIDIGVEISYPSMQSAEKDGFKSEKISQCCSGKRGSHKGYYWRKNND